MDAFKDLSGERDPIYDMLRSHAITLAEACEREGNFTTIPWFLLGSDKSQFSDHRVRSTLRHLEERVIQYLREEKTDTSLLAALPVALHVARSRGIDVPQRIRQGISFSLDQLRSNQRLRTPELVAIVLYFLSECPEHSESVKELQDYLRAEVKKAINASNYALLFDTCMGLIGVSVPVPAHLFEDPIPHRKLMDNERLAKGLIVLSHLGAPGKEKVWNVLREQLAREYVETMMALVQAVTNGLTLVESNLSPEEARASYEALKHQDWTRLVEVVDGKLFVKRVGPGIPKAIDAKTLGLCILAIQKSGHATRICLHPEQYAELEELRKEKLYGFGLDRRQLVILHYGALALILGAGLALIWYGGILEGVVSFADCWLGEQTTWPCLKSVPRPTWWMIGGALLVLAYHRVFELLMQKRRIGSVREVVETMPLIGWGIKRLRGD